MEVFASSNSTGFNCAENLGRNIESVSSFNQPFTDQIFSLIRSADQQGWVLDLVSQAYYARPNNELLARLAGELGIAGVTGVSDAAIAAIIQASSAFRDPASFQQRLDKLAAAVCRIEVGEQNFATGFLVSADLLLTAGHVIGDLKSHNIRISPSDVRLRFDYRGYGSALATGTVFILRRDWLLTWEIASLAAGLNYALLRVDGAPGVQPIGAARAESSAQLRGWIDVSDRPAVSTGAPVLMMAHRSGGPLQLSAGRLVGRSSDTLQLIYENEAWARFEWLAVVQH